MAITSLPAPPSRSDPENFAERADAFMAALPQFAEQANVLQAEVNQTAESVDNDAIAAAASSAYAQDRAESAEASAEAATAAQQTATQKAADAGASASLAEQWATKTDGPVDGGKFSAAHYAALAAAGMGLPVRFLNDLPATDIGPIAVPTQGQMEWVSGRSRYEVLQGDHGQCEFVYVSSVECRLMPRDGDGLIINGLQYRIDPAGVPLSIADVAGAPGSTNYVYAKDNGAGGFSLESSTTGHSRHTDGVRIKTGDPTRTLVGVAYKNASSQFQFDDVIPGVASWFNRYGNAGKGQACLVATASSTPVLAAPGVNTWVWSGEDVIFGTNGVASGTVSGSRPTVTMYLDGTPIISTYGNVATPDGAVPVGMSGMKSGLAEGFHYVELFFSIVGGGTTYLTSGYYLSATR